MNGFFASSFLPWIGVTANGFAATSQENPRRPALSPSPPALGWKCCPILLPQSPLLALPSSTPEPKALRYRTTDAREWQRNTNDTSGVFSVGWICFGCCFAQAKFHTVAQVNLELTKQLRLTLN